MTNSRRIPLSLYWFKLRGVLFYFLEAPFTQLAVCYFFCLMIVQINTADSPVKIANSFSKFVFAKKLANVLSTKSPKKIHKMRLRVLFGNLNFTKSPFITKSHDKNTLIRIEILSKTYISLSFVSLPPQAMLYGISLVMMQM